VKAEAISRLLSETLDPDIDRTVKATQKFLQWRASFEKRRNSFFGKRSFVSLCDWVEIALAN